MGLIIVPKRGGLYLNIKFLLGMTVIILRIVSFSDL